MKKYLFRNIFSYGKPFNITIKEAKDFNDALNKATNWVIKKAKRSAKEFVEQRDMLKQNLEKGITSVETVSIPTQSEFKLENKFQKLYSGLFSEHDIYIPSKSLTPKIEQLFKEL